jgi:hypothetical protein
MINPAIATANIAATPMINPPKTATKEGTVVPVPMLDAAETITVKIKITTPTMAMMGKIIFIMLAVKPSFRADSSDNTLTPQPLFYFVLGINFSIPNNQTLSVAVSTLFLITHRNPSVNGENPSRILRQKPIC